jgi:hypothetical protein
LPVATSSVAIASAPAAVAEEPEYLTRYIVVKHSLRGRLLELALSSKEANKGEQW